MSVYCDFFVERCRIMRYNKSQPYTHEREGEEVTEYTLYMDESETYNSAGNKYFVMSGVIIKNSSYSIWI